MQTIVFYLCYIVWILLFSSAYNTSLILYCFVIWCLHANKRRPCSSTLSGHPSSSSQTQKMAFQGRSHRCRRHSQRDRCKSQTKCCSHHQWCCRCSSSSSICNSICNSICRCRRFGSQAFAKENGVDSFFSDIIIEFHFHIGNQERHRGDIRKRPGSSSAEVHDGIHVGTLNFGVTQLERWVAPPSTTCPCKSCKLSFTIIQSWLVVWNHVFWWLSIY